MKPRRYVGDKIAGAYFATLCKSMQSVTLFKIFNILNTNNFELFLFAHANFYKNMVIPWVREKLSIKKQVSGESY